MTQEKIDQINPKNIMPKASRRNKKQSRDESK